MLLPDSILNNRYRIVRRLGKGGMGAIYEAIDRDLSCTVAIKENLALTDELRYAFTREAKLLANLQHRALPKVMHHFAVKDGQFLVMEFIAGDNLDILLKRRSAPFSPQEVLSWADTLLDVLVYLHTQKTPVIHGDIKPANLKLTPEQNLFLLDFGLAKGKAGQMSSLNTSLPILGYSPSYSPLEQTLNADVRSYNLLTAINPANTARITRERTDPRSDLYSLGSTLYHLISGSCAPEATTRAAHVWAGQPDILVSATELNSQVPEAVSQVLAQALALQSYDRFATAIDMRKALRDAGQALIPGDASAQPVVHEQGAIVDAEETFVRADETVATTLIPVSYGTLGSCESSVRSIAFSPRNEFLASGSNDNKVRLWDLRLRQAKILGQCDFCESGFSYVSSVSFSPNGRYVVSGSSDQAIRVWDIADRQVRIVGRCDDSVCTIAYSPDGKLIASGDSAGMLRLWDVQSGQSMILGQSDGVIWSIAFLPDGKGIASESSNRTIQLWEIGSSHVRDLETDDGEVWSVAVSTDGMFLATGSWDQKVRVWDLTTGALRILGECDGIVRAVAFSPDGQLLASGSDDGSVTLWNLATGGRSILGTCENVVSTIQFSRDGRSVASGSWDSTVRLWKI